MVTRDVFKVRKLHSPSARAYFENITRAHISRNARMFIQFPIHIVCRNKENSLTTKAKHHLESLRISEQIYSHRVPTSFFEEFILRELTQVQVRVRIFLSVEASRFSSIPKLENFLNHKAKITVEFP